MPLKCLRDQERVLSFTLSDAGWDALRLENRQSNCLSFRCCDSKVVLKRSKLGTKYFAHARTGECTTAPMSAEHLLAQEPSALAIEAAGWTADVEHEGTTPSGERWTADVWASSLGRWSTKHRGRYCKSPLGVSRI